MKTEVLPLIADHKPETATLKLSVPSHVVAGRKVWRYRQADWERLQDMLDDTCWDHLRSLSTTVATKWVTNTVLRAAETCIPLTTLRARKSSHPWLDDRAVALVDAKLGPQGTPLEMETTLACCVGLAAEYHDYLVRIAQKMRDLKPSSKLWWKKAKEVMRHEAQVSSTPAPKTNDGVWGLECAGQGSHDQVSQFLTFLDVTLALTFSNVNNISKLW